MKILKMSGEMPYYHDNPAIVLSRLQCMQQSDKRRTWLFPSIRGDRNKLSIFCWLKLNWPVPWNCKTKNNNKKKSMIRHYHPPPTKVQSASKYSKGIYIIHELQVHTRPSSHPRLLNGRTALNRSQTGPVNPTWQPLSPKDWDSFEIFNNALKITEK